LSASRSNSPVAQKKPILRHQGSVKNEKSVKRVSLEVVNEIPGHKTLGKLEFDSLTSFEDASLPGRTSTTTLNKPIFHMGSSFEDKSDDESNYEMNGLNNNNKNVKDENIPLVARKS
jgi:hypothetical protein